MSSSPTGKAAGRVGGAVGTIAIVTLVLAIGSLWLVGAGSATALDAGNSLAGVTTGEPNASEVPVDDVLLDADGPTEVVVRLEGTTPPDTADDPVAHLEAHAAETREPLQAEVKSTDALTIESAFWVTNAVVLEADLDDVDVEALADVDGVVAVHENFDVELVDGSAAGVASGTTDRAARSTAGEATGAIDRIGVPRVWGEYDARGAGTRIAVLDTGLDAEHPDLELHSDVDGDPTHPGGWAEFDRHGALVPGSTPHDTATHGTHVSGTVAGGDASAIAVGVAPEAELLHGLVLPEGSGTFAQVVAGMEWAVAQEADVLTMSFGVNGTVDGFVDPVRNAEASGTAVVAAIGNDGPGTSGSPASVYDAFAVGAVDDEGLAADFSGGRAVDR